MIDASSPLKWVIGRPRTAQRRRAMFGTMAGKGPTGAALDRRPVTISGALSRLEHELRALGADQLSISTNIPTRQDGLPFARVAEPDDPGAVCYFRLDGKPHALACDRWDRVADNLAALAKHVAAIRGQDRWGVGDIAQAFAGFKMLTALEERKSWWQILGFRAPPAVFAEVERAHDRLIRENHPDRGGTGYHAAEINAARDEAGVYYERIGQ
jgi:hypothetical protein